MSVLADVVQWAAVEMLNRSDLVPIASRHALNAYRLICGKVPFAELEASAASINTAVGQRSYSLVGTVTSFLAGVLSVRIEYSSTNGRRMKRSHTRLYDAISTYPNGRPSVYARYGTNIEIHPPADSADYLMKVRYWIHPNCTSIPLLTAATNASPVVFTSASHTLATGDYIDIRGGTSSWAGVNGYLHAVTKVDANSFSIPINSTGFGAFSGQSLTAKSLRISSHTLLMPEEWEELLMWETLYRLYTATEQHDKAMLLVAPTMTPRMPTPKKITIREVGIIPRLWNDLLQTVYGREGVDEDFSINPISRPYSG